MGVLGSEPMVYHSSQLRGINLFRLVHVFPWNRDNVKYCLRRRGKMRMTKGGGWEGGGGGE